MQENDSLARDMIWNTIGNLVYCICQWIITILTVRIDSYGAVGYLSLAMSTSSTFSTIAMFSMRNFQVSDVKEEFCDNDYIASRILTCIMALVGCFIYSLKSTDTYQMWCINAFMLVRIAESIVDVLHGINQKFRRYDLIGKSYLLRGIITIVCFLSGLVGSRSILIAIILTGIGNLSVAIIFDIRETRKLDSFKVVFKQNKILSLLKKCIPIVVTSFLLSMIPLLPRNAVQEMMGNDMLGVYSSIASPTLIVQVFATYAFNPLIPKISLFFVEKRYENFLKVFHTILLIFVVLGVGVNIGALLLGKFGLKILYGEEILKNYSLFMPLVWCTILTAYVWILNSVITAIRQIIPMMMVMIVSFIIDVILKNSFILWFGVNGASYIQILCLFVVIVSLIVIIEKNICDKQKKV